MFFIGLAALLLGGGLLVQSGTKLALRYQISPLVIGLTVIAFGTSASEIAFCALAAWKGEDGLVIGNIVGSNITNILLILGLAATLSPIKVTRRLIWIEVPLLLLVSALFWLLSWQFTLSYLLGSFLLLLLLSYLAFILLSAKKEIEAPPLKNSTPLWLILLTLLFSLVLLGFGSEWLIRGSITLARLFGVSELFIALTMVALGTSLPELVTSIIAVCRGEKQMAVGNVIGSNIFNLLGVGGISALASRGGIMVPAAALRFDMPVMLGATIGLLPLFFTGHMVSRAEGILLLFYYVLYITYLILHATNQQLLPLFQSAIWFFIIPLTLMGLLFSLFQHRRQ